MTIRYNLYNFEALFRKYLIAGKFSPSSIKNYLSDLRHFLGWYKTTYLSDSNNKEGSIMPQNINCIDFLKHFSVQSITDYRYYLLDNNIPIKTINRRLATLRRFCHFSFAQGWLKENYSKKIKNVSNFSVFNNKKTLEILNKYRTYLSNQKIEKNEINNCLNNVKEFLEFFSKKDNEQKIKPFLSRVLL